MADEDGDEDEDDFRGRLERAGLWEDFCLYREGLSTGGVNLSEAFARAVEEFDRRLDGIDGPPSEPEPDDSDDSQGCTPPSPARPPDAAGDDSELKVEGNLGGPSCGGDGDASIVRTIQWVAQNLEVHRPRKSLAPSAEAWGMLLSYRRNPDRKDEFWDKVFVRLIPSRAQLSDEEKGKESDGSRLVDAIRKIEGVVKAIEEAGVAG